MALVSNSFTWPHSNFFYDPQSPPIIVAVMGMTGVGKSTFIRSLTKDQNIKVGKGMRSCMNIHSK